MGKYLAIVTINSTNSHLPIKVNADNFNNAILKSVQYCISEGYSISKIEVVQLLLTVGVVELD